MTPATARRLSALESAAATKTKDPKLMSLDELQAAIAEHFGHVPTSEELREEIRRLTAEGTDTARGAA